MAVSSTSSFGVTPQFLSFMQFKEDSKALKSSVKTANAIEKNMQKESDKAVEDMKQFFVSIGKEFELGIKSHFLAGIVGYGVEQVPTYLGLIVTRSGELEAVGVSVELEIELPDARARDHIRYGRSVEQG